MSEYQYYEFCKLTAPLTEQEREVMCSLSSRAKIGTHGAVYIYNYGDFRGNEIELVKQYFDVFFYIANWGDLRLVFKYPVAGIDQAVLKKYCVDDLISYEVGGSYVILDIFYGLEEGFSGCLEFETALAELLPLYYEIKRGDYTILKILANIYHEKINYLDGVSNKVCLSHAQQAFLQCIEEYEVARN